VSVRKGGVALKLFFFLFVWRQGAARSSRAGVDGRGEPGSSPDQCLAPWRWAPRCTALRGRLGSAAGACECGKSGAR
jgi:hypothetical protein